MKTCTQRIKHILYYTMLCLCLSKNRYIQTSLTTSSQTPLKNYVKYIHMAIFSFDPTFTVVFCFIFHFQEGPLHQLRQWGKLKCGLFETTGIFHFLAHGYQMLNLLEASTANLPNPSLRSPAPLCSSLLTLCYQQESWCILYLKCLITVSQMCKAG